uniref:Oocyte secreted protein 1 n=1 Tax=Prolemur simus TaxID=1328070 RepID=A0A8C8YR83_PROSS
MKTFLELRGLFLLHCFIWTCAEDWAAIQAQCTLHWFCARIKPTIFHNYYVNPQDVYLGDDCPVTDVEPDAYYEFFYHPSECGIVTKTFEEFVLFKTKITHMPIYGDNQSEMPLSCVLRKQQPPLNEVGRRVDETGRFTQWETRLRIHAENEDMGSCFCNAILVLEGKIVFRTVLSFVSKTLPKRG